MLSSYLFYCYLGEKCWKIPQNRRNGIQKQYFSPAQAYTPWFGRISWTELLVELSPRCADIHYIENWFLLIKCNSEDEAIKQNVTKESFQQFKERVLRAFNNISIEEVDKLIISMARRIEAVLASKGYITKY